MKPAALTYDRPASLADALSRLAALAGRGRLIAGGQSLGPMLNFRIVRPDHLLDISRIDDLRGANFAGGSLVIGACVTHAEIEDGRIPDVTRGLLPFVARQIAYRAVRNRGTIGGSLAHADPAADWLTTTIALDAQVRLVGRAGERRVPVADFVTGVMETAIREDEIIAHVVIPALSDAARWGHAKYAKKPGDFAQSMAVAVADPARGLARVVLGRRAEPPALLRAASGLIAANGTRPAAPALRAAVEADLDAAAVDAGDRIMHRAMIERAVRGLAA
jgi:aerobic carbon-monoxide dehydrogenase medium subunit